MKVAVIYYSVRGARPHFSPHPRSPATLDTPEPSRGVPALCIAPTRIATSGRPQTYGHMAKMAHKVAEGINSVEGCHADVFQVAETLSAEILEKMHAPPKASDPVIDAATMATYDAVVFGCNGRYGMVPAQMKTFFDSCGQLWSKGAMTGKASSMGCHASAACLFLSVVLTGAPTPPRLQPATIVVSTGTPQGGQETIALTTLPFLVHMGMIYVPTGYSFGAEMFDTATVHAGSPYGAGTFAGADGSRQPSDMELRFAAHHGKYFAGIAKKIAA